MTKEEMIQYLLSVELYKNTKCDLFYPRRMIDSDKVVPISELTERFIKIDKINGGKLWNIRQILENIDMIVPLEKQPTANNWIPCSERLPEDRREVLVTAYWHETYQVMMGSYFGDGLWWCVPFNNCGDHNQKLTPIAWMPLIEAYSDGE